MNEQLMKQLPSHVCSSIALYAHPVHPCKGEITCLGEWMAQRAGYGWTVVIPNDHDYPDNPYIFENPVEWLAQNGYVPTYVFSYFSGGWFVNGAAVEHRPGYPIPHYWNAARQRSACEFAKIETDICNIGW
jgi:hypothetical protein